MNFRSIVGLRLVPCLLLAGCISTETNPVEVSLDDAARANLQLGAAYLQRNDLALAREKLEKAVEQDPDLPSARAYLGLVYERIGNQKDARRQYDAAIRLAPDEPSIVNTYGGYLCRHEERKEGIKYFLRAARNPLYLTPEAAYVNAAVCARGIPDPEAAEDYLRRALALNASYRSALLQLADLSMDTGQPLQARAFLQRFHAAGSVTADSLALSVRVETALGDRDAAVASFKELDRLFPDRARELRAELPLVDAG
jgi:type IV pilus assembly protein PilF